MADRLVDYRVKLVPIESITRAAYNPRKADKERDELLELSFRKLGWLLPAVIDEKQELLSGHQRTRITSALGATHIPAIGIPRLPEEKRRVINLLMNRSTNDMQSGDTSQSLKEELLKDKDAIIESMRELPDLDPTSEDFFPCVHVESLPVREIVDRLRGYEPRAERNVAEHSARLGVYLPIVLEKDGEPVNGYGRSLAYLKAGFTHAPCISVSPEKAFAARRFLNLLTMDFTLEEQYADLLRYNSFRRAVGAKEGIGKAFQFDIWQKGVKDFDSPTVWDKWKAHYGTTVFDFGAGLLQDTKRLKAVGVDCTPLEPFVLEKGEIDIDRSRDVVRSALSRIGEGQPFSSVFMNSVMNSVPFLQDRKHIVALVAALCGRATRAHVCAISRGSSRARRVLDGKVSVGERHIAQASFALDYEPNVAIGELASKPKMQKYHTQTEWYDLWDEAFGWVKVTEWQSLVCAVCKRPKPIDPVKLGAAIDFEFEIKYPNGESMGLSDLARDSFAKRLGIKIP